MNSRDVKITEIMDESRPGMMTILIEMPTTEITCICFKCSNTWQSEIKPSITKVEFHNIKYELNAARIDSQGGENSTVPTDEVLNSETLEP